MPDLVLTDDGFDPMPAAAEPPEGDVELALQEEVAATDVVAPPASPPPVVGRSYHLDLATGRLQPEGHVPAAINGAAAMRQAIEKALRTPRGSAAVQGDDYGREEADRDAEGQPFDAAAFADLEDRTRDALLVLPWVLAVQDFDVVEDLEATATGAIVTFRVVPEGDDEPLLFDRFPLPSP
jgi:hypothetical protein